MPTVITGQRATAATNAIQSARRVVDMHDEILLLEPDKAPLSLLASMISRKSVFNPKFDILEDELIPALDRVNNGAGYTAGDTSIVVDNGAYFRPNSLAVVQRTGEVLSVTSVSTNTLTVARSWGGTAAAALVDNDQISILAGAAAEGATIESAKSTQTTNAFNYTEIKRWPIQVTGTEAASELYGGADLGYQRRKGAIEWARDLDLVFFFGERNEDTSGTTPRRSTGGLKEYISTNSQDFGGGFNMTTFMSFAESVFRYGSKDKVLFASRGLVTNISLEAIQYLEKQDEDSSFGMDIRRLVTPHGRLRIITHDSLEGDTYKGYGFIVDPENVGYRYLRGRDVKLLVDVGLDSTDAQTDEFLGEVGLFRAQEKTHALITNAAS